MRRRERVVDTGDRIGEIISLNLENRENSLWICANGGQLTTGKLNFTRAKNETEIESRGIKVGDTPGKPFSFWSTPAGAF